MPKRESKPVRIDMSLYQEATAVASLMSRSVAQQVAHWARIGRELEADPSVSLSGVSTVLERSQSYDSLSHEEQAVVRAFWKERIRQLRSGLRLDQRFAREGRPWVELDDGGDVVRREPESTGD